MHYVQINNMVIDISKLVHVTINIYIFFQILLDFNLDCCQIIILSIYVPSTHAKTRVLGLSLDFPYETR